MLGCRFSRWLTIWAAIVGVILTVLNGFIGSGFGAAAFLTSISLFSRKHRLLSR
uniref:Bm13053 n=1 Tax=Brugia malayi TaxID=6279 RepID=A0A0J9XQ56_BRUMA|nr:Bm13053 [Brugia malayi]